jgi:hypothetical protein
VIPGWLKLLAIAGAILALAALAKSCRNDLIEQGRQEERAAHTARALQDAESKAREGLRRTERQEENQRAQDALVARLRDAAARNAAHADRVQRDYAAAAHQWNERLAHSPTAEDIQAAGAAITVCADVRRRLDQAAGELAAFAGASRAAGLKCEADYDALTLRPAP